MVRGMVRIETGRSGINVLRFNAFERFVHCIRANLLSQEIKALSKQLKIRNPSWAECVAGRDWVSAVSSSAAIAEIPARREERRHPVSSLFTRRRCRMMRPKAASSMLLFSRMMRRTKRR
jgi:hypothetical protein